MHNRELVERRRDERRREWLASPEGIALEARVTRYDELISAIRKLPIGLMTVDEFEFLTSCLRLDQGRTRFSTFFTPERNDKLEALFQRIS